MKLTKKLEAEIIQVMNDYWDSYFKGDLQHWATYLVNDYRNIGGTEEEIWNSKKEILDYTHRIVDQIEGVTELRNKQTQIIPYNPYFMVHELLDIYIKIEGEWTFYQKFRLSSLIQKNDGEWKVLHQHGSYPDSKTIKGEAFAFDEIKAENIRLLEAVKNRTIELENKNRELEIETALERVRTVAMGMNKPDDILGICKIMFIELHSLGFSDLRNTLINFWDDSNNSLVDYDYSDYAGGNKAKLAYSSHPVFEQFQKKIKKSKDAFAKLVVKKDQLESWKQRRRERGEYEDPRLNNIPALFYYFYSIGVGAIGISTFSSLSAEKLDLLKRFRNVFSLAYQRYTDISLAEAQAREAEIELALERIRARTMAMQKSDELPEAANLLFLQVQALGMPAWSAGYCIWEDNKKAVTFWMSSEGLLQPPARAPLTEDSSFIHMRQAYERGESFFVEEIGGEELVEHYKYMRTLPLIGEILDSIIEAGHPLPTFQIFHLAYFSQGFLLFITYEPVPGAHEIFKRFGKVFDQTYTRFLDLQKAEAQLREAKIEAALERVRSRSLAMHKSDELNEVVSIIFEKLKELQIPATAVGIAIYIDGSKDLNAFVCGENEAGLVITNYRLPYFNNPIPKDLSNALEKQLDFFVGHYSKKEKNSFYKYVFEHTDEFRHLPGDVIRMIFESSSYTITMVAVKNAVFNINDFEGKVLSGNEVDIIKRFARVFDQAYTRFLDLQKAEAQAREAKIETALEKIRSRTMAMQNSDDLQNAAILLFEQVKSLGIKTGSCGFFIWMEDKKTAMVWNSSQEGGLQIPFKLPHTEIPHYKRVYEAAKKGDEFHVEEVAGEALEKQFNYLRKLDGIKEIIKIYDDAGIALPSLIIYHDVFFKQGYLSFHTHEPAVDAHDIFKRFTKVFEQTYTRFLDLQKAEAQAKEAQIELALERVRARTMAMQKSDELADAAQLLYQEFGTLGINTFSCGYMFIDEVKKTQTGWVVLPDGVLLSDFIVFPLTGDHVLDSRYKEWKEKKPLHIYEIQGEVNRQHHRFLADHVPPFVVLDIFSKMPDRIVFNCANFSDGYLLILATQFLSPEEQQTIIRFAKVFEMTYIRFLDLQKAEAQAREAKIETALERVRSRSMGMQKSEELKEVIQVVYEQFVHLNIHIEHAGFVVDYKPKGDWHFWIADKQLSPSRITHPYFDSVWANQFNEAKEKGTTFFTTNLNFKEKNKFYKKLLTYVPGLTEEVKEFYFSCPGLGASTVLLENVGLYIENFSGIPYTDEENKILMRFGKVFEQAYTRFLDLQKAEAQAREAEIELALERVRARTMAMQTSNELQETVVVLFQEFKKLGADDMQQFTIGIYNEEERVIDFRVTSWSGGGSQENRSFQLDMDEPSLIKPAIAAWKAGKKSAVFDLTGEALQGWLNYRNKISGITLSSIEMDGRRVISAAYFSKGHLTISTLIPLPEQTIKILERFAAVFDGTYTRFLDLQKAEAQAREATIEAALERVRFHAMAMQNSNDVGVATATMFNELEKLGIQTMRCGIAIINDKQTMEVWSVTNTDDGKIVKGAGTFDMNAHPLWQLFYNGWKQKDEFLYYYLADDDKKAYYNIIANAPGYAVQAIPEQPNQSFQCYYFGEGSIWTFSLHPYSEAENLVLKKFTAVFSLTFRRYQDLQKAEAQAKEALIEASLERVRSKTMAMHNSMDVGETVATMFAEFVHLGISTNRCGILIFNDEYIAEVWTAKPTAEAKAALIIGKLNLDVHRLLSAAYAAWRAKETFYQYNLLDEDLLNYYIAINNSKFYPTQFDLSSLPPTEFHSDFFFADGAVFSFTQEPIAEESLKIIKRFAGVFGQTYRRYLDLQKAEALAREAKIEASLERVRSKAMAMYNSQDLADTIGVFYKELQSFSITPRRCGVGLLNKENKEGELFTWNTTEQGESLELVGKMKMEGHTILENVYSHWLTQTEYHPVLRGNEIKEYYQVIRPMMAFPDYQHNEVQYGYFFFFNEGGVYAWSENEMNENELQIYRRFTSVLSLTYKRYKDLQQAEANAREAKVEAALERVRSRTLAMQSSNELAETAAEVFKQLIGLGIEPNRLYIGIIKGEMGDMEMWATDEDGTQVGTKFMFNKNENASVKKLHDGWEAKEKSVIVDMEGKELEDYFHYLKEVMHIPFKGGLTQKRRVQSVAYFSKGFIGMASPDGQGNETIQLLERFAAVFNLTFTRFNDLKMAEAHAIQAEEDLIKLQTEKKRAEDALTELKSTQTQLVQSEKMASLGELTAGIAHEIQNPLNFVNNFSEVSKELLDEMREAIEKGNTEDAKEIMNDVIQNLEKINHHGKRADGIVKGMLQHSRSSSGVKEPTDINALCDEYLRLTYHGLRAKDSRNPADKSLSAGQAGFNATMKTDFDASLEKINIIPQDVGRVILNLLTNAFYVVDEKKKSGVSNYEPTVSVSTKKIGDKVLISVKDNGNGIPQKVLNKIFQPFFTTKPTGQGTGLGLSLSYDIVRAHGGEIKVETKIDQGTTFIIQLPA